jgi:hypothetical protein
MPQAESLIKLALVPQKSGMVKLSKYETIIKFEISNVQDNVYSLFIRLFGEV